MEAKTHIPTDVMDDVTRLRTVLNCAIRDITGKVIDVSVKEFGSIRLWLLT